MGLQRPRVKGSETFGQVSYFWGTMIVDLNKFPQLLREAPAPLTEVRHDVLYEAVSIFLSVRQQLQRIDQISAQALRYCMRVGDLGPIDTFTCVYNQEPVWLLPVEFTNCAPPIVAPFSARDSPNVVFQLETVTMRAQVRHRSASLPPRWRDDASQLIYVSYHDFLDGALFFCFILCHLLESFLSSVKGPILTSFQKVLYILPTLHFLRRESPASSFCACSQCHYSI